jgi:hypothetical protein
VFRGDSSQREREKFAPLTKEQRICHRLFFPDIEKDAPFLAIFTQQKRSLIASRDYITARSTAARVSHYG